MTGRKEGKPEWCELKPKKKHLYDVRMEKLRTGPMQRIECPSDMGREFRVYEKNCDDMNCAECWSQEVQEDETSKEVGRW